MRKLTPKTFQTEIATVYIYPIILVAVAKLPGNTHYCFKHADTQEGLGAIFVQGSLLPVGRNPNPPLNTSTGYHPPFQWDADGEAEFVTAPEGCEWVCCSSTRGLVPMLTRLTVNGSATIPAGSGFVVASGSIALGDETGSQGDCFDVSPEDSVVTGTAELLLVQ